VGVWVWFCSGTRLCHTGIMRASSVILYKGQELQSGFALGL